MTILNSVNMIDAIYLDATDAQTEGTFLWSTTNSTLNYTNWAPNEPNNCCGDRNDSCCGGEDCLTMIGLIADGRDHKVGEWNDWNCSSRHESVCEMDLSASMTHFPLGKLMNNKLSSIYFSLIFFFRFKML